MIALAVLAAAGWAAAFVGWRRHRPLDPLASYDRFSTALHATTRRRLP